MTVRVRVSPYTGIVLAMCLAEVVCIVLALVVPWGKTATGTDIRSGLDGLLPWFLFIPVLLQVGYFMVESRFLQSVYLVLNFILGLFILFFLYLTHVRYGPGFEAGFYLVLAGAAIALLAGLACIFERVFFEKLLEAGKARKAEMPLRRRKTSSAGK